RRAGPRPARVRIHAERPLQARGRSRPHARGARRELGGAGRGGADGDAPLRASRSLRAAQGAHARQARRRRGDEGVHQGPCAAGGREGAAAEAHAGDVYWQGRRARPQALTPPSPRQALADFGSVYFANGVVPLVFAPSGPGARILAVGTRGGLTPSDLASWIFGAFFVNGLISIAF